MVVLDNAPIHHVDGVVDLIESTGALVIFLPPYSPDLNAIEEAFSKLKMSLKANEEILDISDIACTSITENDWIKHAGYVISHMLIKNTSLVIFYWYC